MLLDRLNFFREKPNYFYAYSLKCLDSFPSGHRTHPYTEAKFLDVIGTKVLRVFLLAINSHLSPLLLSKSNLKLVCNVNIVYGNLKSEISQDYAQKPQQKIVRS